MSGHKSLSGDYYSEDDLRSAGFRSIGTDVKIHERANIFGAEHISIGEPRPHRPVRQCRRDVADRHRVVHSHRRVLHMSVSCGLTIGSFSAFGVGFQDIYVVERLRRPLPAVAAAVHSLRAAKGCRAGRRHVRGHNIVGTNALILPGVTFAEGSAVGAMCVVQESLQPWTFYVGAPARKVRDRSRDVVDIARLLERSNG